MAVLNDPVVEHRYDRQVAAFRSPDGELACDIAVIPYECVPILVHLDPAGENRTVPWPSVRNAHPLLSEMDQLGLQHWDAEEYRALCGRLGLDPDRGRPAFEPSLAELGEALVRKGCDLHAEHHNQHRTTLMMVKASAVNGLVRFLRVGGDRSRERYGAILWDIHHVADEIADDRDYPLIRAALIEAEALIVEPEPEPEFIREFRPRAQIEERRGLLSRLLGRLRGQRLH